MMDLKRASYDFGKVQEILERLLKNSYKLSESGEVLLRKFADVAVKNFGKSTRPRIACILEGSENSKVARIFAYSNRSGLNDSKLSKDLHPLEKNGLKKRLKNLKIDLHMGNVLSQQPFQWL